jgi:hypothetical protein
LKPAVGLYAPFPLTVTAAPTFVPPLVQVVGGLACGPNTLNVTVPVGLAPPAIVELIELAAIVVLVASVEGAATVLVGLAFPTTVELMPDPQVLAAAVLLVSPL